MNDLPIIQARGVAKRFGNFEALAALDIGVKKGQCVGLLGPNGAGKSTFIGCLYGVVSRSGGELEVFGMDPAKQPPPHAPEDKNRDDKHTAKG
jgi:lipooligosaccharide transport system ATP-binding protein